MIAASKAAYRLRDRLPPLEKHLTEANYLNSVVHDDAGAIAAYRAALEVSPDDKTALNNIGMVLTSNGQFEEAERVLRHGVTVTPTFSLYRNLGWALASENKIAALDSLPAAWSRGGGDSVHTLELQLDVATVERNRAASTC